MARGNTCVVEGNMTKDIELLIAASGNAIGRGSVAWNQSKKVGNNWEETPHYFDFVVFGDLAENVASSLNKGDRVIVEGRLDFSTWEDNEGNTRRTVSIVADSVSPCLRWATAQVSRIKKGQGKQDVFAGAGVSSSAPDEENF